MSVKKWLVIITNPRAEKLVSKRLYDLGIENYVPIRRELKQWKDRKKWVDVVLFKGYVFIHILEKERNTVFEVFGVVRFLYVSKKIAVVTNQEIEILHLFCKVDEVKIESKGFVTGDEVEIMHGPLIGMRGILKESQKGIKISIYIEVLGLFASIGIKISEVRKVEI